MKLLPFMLSINLTSLIQTWFPFVIALKSCLDLGCEIDPKDFDDTIFKLGTYSFIVYSDVSCHPRSRFRACCVVGHDVAIYLFWIATGKASTAVSCGIPAMRAVFVGLRVIWTCRRNRNGAFFRRKYTFYHKPTVAVFVDGITKLTLRLLGVSGLFLKQH